MHIRCTNCAADVQIGDATKEVVCGFCNTLLFVGKQRGMPHVAMSEYVTPADAVLRMGRFLSKREITQSPRILNRQKMYFPFWHLNFENKARATKWVAAWMPPAEALLSISPDSGDTGQIKMDDVPRHLLADPTLHLEDALQLGQCRMTDLDGDRPAALVHVPFEKIQYQVMGQTLDAYVDLVSGVVYADNLPPTPQRYKSRMLGIVAAVALAVAVAL
ncbi:MAG: hypothetical protein JXX14_26390, partial [Deltaproteobacteria bacterium]|nr:hypothetical protein [Deltaproteobacteria bacterium]